MHKPCLPMVSMPASEGSTMPLQNTTTRVAAEKIGIISGPAMAGTGPVTVTIRGVGGQGTAPEETKDPIVMAAEFILEIQTLISRRNNPLGSAVIAVDSSHGNPSNGCQERPRVAGSEYPRTYCRTIVATLKLNTAKCPSA